MTTLIHSKEDNYQTEANSSSEAEQILHLKRLLVTLKQHYEKSLYHSQTQLQLEQNQRVTLQKELEGLQIQLKETQTMHDDELFALRDQQMSLKELLQKAQEELKEEQIKFSKELQQGRIEQLEQMVPDLRNCADKEKLEIEHLREALEEAHRKQTTLEQELSENRQKSQQEIEHLHQLLELQKRQEDSLETVVSHTSSHHLRQELEMIKQTLMQGAQEAKALEVRYIEVLNEKISLEQQSKQFQLQIEHQSSNLTAFQKQLHEMEEHKNRIEQILEAKETELLGRGQEIEESQKRIQQLEEVVLEKDYIQEKYEELKDEWMSLSEHFEEEGEMRIKAEHCLKEIEAIANHQEMQLKESIQQLQTLQQERLALEEERDQLRISFEETEARLKVAQQHLAKKVKETALLGEKVEEQHLHLTDSLQTIEHQKTQLAQLQASLDFYQKQEKRLQEQLHDALKGTESQVVKWEEKYFGMYDKWQECENQIRELKKFEEKHQQMQHLLANLGNFMGNSLNSSNPLFQQRQKMEERSARPFSFETSLTEETSSDKPETQEEKYDLFGIRQTQETYQPRSFS